MENRNYKVNILPAAREDMDSIVVQFEFLPDRSARSCFNLMCGEIAGLRSCPQRYPLMNDPTLAALGYRALSIVGYLVVFSVTVDTVLIQRILFEKEEYKLLL